MQTFLNVKKENDVLLQIKWYILRFNEDIFITFWRCQRISKENVQTWFFFESFFVVFVKMKEIKTYPFHFENKCYNEDKIDTNKWILLVILSLSIHFLLHINKTEKIISRNQLVTFKCSHAHFFHFYRKSRKKQRVKMKGREANELFDWFQIKNYFLIFSIFFVLFVEMST